MFRKLLMTEIRANTWFLGISALVNLCFVVLLALMEDQSLELFIGATTLVFYIHVIVLTVGQYDGKRMRLYTQLPLSPQTIFWACWSFLLLWLLLQTGIWLLYALILDPGTTPVDLALIPKAALNILVIMAIVAIAIDLFSFEPKLMRWLYLAGLAAALVVAVRYDSRFEASGNGDRFSTFVDWLGAPWGFVAVGVAIVLLLLVDRAVFTRSENYLS